jgi:hypothetical protein
MRSKILLALTLLLLGFIVSIISWNSSGLGAGYMAIWIGYPLIIAGILLLFSSIGIIIFFVGWVFFLLVLFLGLSFLLVIVLIILAIGIFWAIVEGIVKLISAIKPSKKGKRR